MIRLSSVEPTLSEWPTGLTPGVMQPVRRRWRLAGRGWNCTPRTSRGRRYRGKAGSSVSRPSWLATAVRGFGGGGTAVRGRDLDHAVRLEHGRSLNMVREREVQPWHECDRFRPWYDSETFRPWWVGKNPAVAWLHR